MASIIRQRATAGVATRAFCGSACTQAGQPASAGIIRRPRSNPPSSRQQFSPGPLRIAYGSAGPSEQWRLYGSSKAGPSGPSASAARAYSNTAKPPRPRRGDPFATDKLVQWSDSRPPRRRDSGRPERGERGERGGRIPWAERRSSDAQSSSRYPPGDGGRGQWDRGDRGSRGGWRDRPDGGDRGPRDEPGEESAAPKRRWNPQKKLTHATMAAVRELARQDPELWTKAALSKQFGVSYEAVGRILRSKFREKQAAQAAPASTGRDIGKWATEGQGMSIAERADPAAFVRKAYALKRSVGEKKE